MAYTEVRRDGITTFCTECGKKFYTTGSLIYKTGVSRRVQIPDVIRADTNVCPDCAQKLAGVAK